MKGSNCSHLWCSYSFSFKCKCAKIIRPNQDEAQWFIWSIILLRISIPNIIRSYLSNNEHSLHIGTTLRPAASVPNKFTNMEPRGTLEIWAREKCSIKQVVSLTKCLYIRYLSYRSSIVHSKKSAPMLDSDRSAVRFLLLSQSNNGAYSTSNRCTNWRSLNIFCPQGLRKTDDRMLIENEVHFQNVPIPVDSYVRMDQIRCWRRGCE